MMFIKVREATRPRLFWLCKIINHFFIWKVDPFDWFCFKGQCFICGCRRNQVVSWPAPPARHV